MRFFKSLSFRLLGIAFIGTHVPLLYLLLWYVSSPTQVEPYEVMIASLCATLVDTAMTLFLIHWQIRPLIKATAVFASATPGQPLPQLPEADAYEIRQLFQAIEVAYAHTERLADENRDLLGRLSKNKGGLAFSAA